MHKPMSLKLLYIWICLVRGGEAVEIQIFLSTWQYTANKLLASKLQQRKIRNTKPLNPYIIVDSIFESLPQFIKILGRNPRQQIEDIFKYS